MKIKINNEEIKVRKGIPRPTMKIESKKQYKRKGKHKEDDG